MISHLVVNENIQTVDLWLSTEETTMLDNALITMEHLYKTGVANIRLRRLMNEESHYDLEYCIGKGSEQSEDDEQAETSPEKLRFILPMADVNDHKRQLTFCNVDLPENMMYKTIQLKEQLKLLHIVEKIFATLIKLEMAGHPNYQFRDERYEIRDPFGKK
jgi:hypothetical protein